MEIFNSITECCGSMPEPNVDIEKHAGDILSAIGERAATSGSSTHRQCTIKIENNSSDYKLMDPRNYSYSGSCKKHLPDTISVSKSGKALFIKAPNTASGSVGVFTYDLYQNSTKQNKGKMAVMFSNPFDFNLYSNWFAVGVFDMNKQCDYDLYYEMYYNDENGFVRSEAKGGGLTYRSDGVNIRVTMSDSYQPVINVQLSDD